MALASCSSSVRFTSNVPVVETGRSTEEYEKLNETGKIMRGKASYYADKFHGRKTANGEIYDHRNLTAAHRSLPFGTMVRVINLENGKSVIVKINDRGPFVRGRVIDLSRAAAEAIDMIHIGVCEVEVIVLD
ncbi:MAG: septal ring lytic transglycosylase RlpA family protein [Candidatus Kapaibacterium sp.]